MPDIGQPTGSPPASLYAAHRKIYPRAVKGQVRRVKWTVLALLLALYYVVPWLRWDRGPGVPDQAVLVDMQHARLFFFWIELWPQEVYFLTGLLILGAVGLFAATSLFGRVWCGFACPQTVWTDLFLWVERRIEGDRNARMRRDAGPPSRDRRLRRLAKHAAWLGIAAATGGAWVMYFQDAPSLVLHPGSVSLQTWLFFALFTATTYVLAGFAREQVCTYMCPWPRFQGAMLDQDSLVVTYRDWRGEPRGTPKDLGNGDCVDCSACVQVCPTGVDIREGQQLACIGCGLCIDACDDVMRKLRRPEGLIGFETLANLTASTAATAEMEPGPARLAAGLAARRPPRLLRPRVLMYAGVLAAVGVAMLGALLLRETLSLTVLPERAPPYVRLSDGGIRNAFLLKLADKSRERGRYTLVLEEAQGLRLLVQDVATDAAGRPLLPVRGDGVASFRALVTAGPELPHAERQPLRFRLLDAAGRPAAEAQSIFLGPQP